MAIIVTQRYWTMADFRNFRFASIFNIIILKLAFLIRYNFHIFWYVNETYKTLLIPYCITLNLHTFSCCPHFITIIPIIMLLLSSPIMLSSLIIPLQHYNRSISIQKLWQIEKLSSIDLNSVIIPISFFLQLTIKPYLMLFQFIWVHLGSFGFIWALEKSDINWICIEIQLKFA